MKQDHSNGTAKTVTLNKKRGISKITVEGFKSISTPQSIEIKPLTVLAGANNSGKSSMMQPLLLLKQTLEASYDPGPLLLNGPNIKFTSADQFFSLTEKQTKSKSFSIGIHQVSEDFIRLEFERGQDGQLRVKKCTYKDDSREMTFHSEMTHAQILSAMPVMESVVKRMSEDLFKMGKTPSDIDPELLLPKLGVRQNRCFLELDYYAYPKGSLADADAQVARTILEYFLRITSLYTVPGTLIEGDLKQILHLPGLRGNPLRDYPVTAVGDTFPGRFEDYSASIIAKWQSKNDVTRIEKVTKDLLRLGLTWKVVAKRIDDTKVELRVGRLPIAGKRKEGDLVNIADVGFGVSQTLPVLVALHLAKPGQLVYLEEPEAHLHPKAQTALAQVIADAAKRGVRVVIETHSSLLLLGVQTLVAEEKLSADLVKLHWFTRDKTGATLVRSADLDSTGAFGNWPEDFAEAEMQAESRYLDAAEARQHVH